MAETQKLGRSKKTGEMMVAAFDEQGRLVNSRVATPEDIERGIIRMDKRGLMGRLFGGSPEVPGLSVREEQAVDNITRFTVKQLVDNPEQAKAFLRAQGKWVFDLNPGGIFPHLAVQDMTFNEDGDIEDPDMRPSAWGVVDPNRTELKDFLLDNLFDLVAEAGIEGARALSGLAGLPSGPGAAATQAAGSGAAGFGSEVVRQALGTAMGSRGDGEFNPALASGVGLASAALPGLGGLVGRRSKQLAQAFLGQHVDKLTKKHGPNAMKYIQKNMLDGQIPELQRLLSSKFAGIIGSDQISGGDLLLSLSRIFPDRAPKIEEVGSIMVATIDKLDNKIFPEELAVQELLEASGKFIDITDEIRGLRAFDSDLIGDPGATTRFNRLRENVLVDLGQATRQAPTDVPIGRDLATRQRRGGPGGVDPVLGAPIREAVGVGPVKTRRVGGGRPIDPATGAPVAAKRIVVSAGDALRIARNFGKIAADAGLWEQKAQKQTKKTVEKEIAESFGSIRGKLQRGLGSSEDLPGEQLSNRFGELMRDMQKKQLAMGSMVKRFGTGTQDPAQIGRTKDPYGPIASFFSGGSTGFRSDLKLFDAAYGNDLTRALQSSIGQVGKQTKAKLRNGSRRELIDLGLNEQPDGSFLTDLEVLVQKGKVTPSTFSVIEAGALGRTAGPERILGLAPEITATANIRGESMGRNVSTALQVATGVGGGAKLGAAGGLPGMITAGAAGGLGAFFLGTPRGAGALTRFVAGENNAGALLRSGARGVGSVASSLGFALQQIPAGGRGRLAGQFEAGSALRGIGRKIAESDLFKAKGKPVVQEDKSAMRKELEGNQ